MMKSIKTIVLVGIVAFLVLASGGVVAQNSVQPQEVNAPDATVNSAISYQGKLTDPATGDPLDGNFDLEFSFWTLNAGGSQLWPATLKNNQSITNGLYRTDLPVDQDLVHGQEMWLQIRMRETGTTTWETLTPRIQILPTVYALSLRPGARMEDAIDRPNAIVNATNTSHGFGLRGESRHVGGYGILGYLGNAETWAYGAGVKGSVLATGYGVVGSSDSGHGVGIAGYTQDGYGVYGFDGGAEEARGYGGYFLSTNGVGVYGVSAANSTWNNMYTPGVYGRSTNGVGVYGRSTGTTTWKSMGVLGWGHSGPGGVFVSYTGNLLEGWEDVSGDGLLLETRFKVDYNGNVYADGTYQSPAADLAEMLPASEGLEPGDVLIIGQDGELARSAQAYQPTVAGVYSSEPGFLAASDHKEQAGYSPLALAGVVPVKASAENGPIVPGDLLAASDTPGHCMRADLDPPVGTVIGKALEGLDAGTGIIQMLVMLR
jgi:hypothetical protein